MVIMDHYKRGEGIIEKFPSFTTVKEARDFMNQWCEKNNHRIVAHEWNDTTVWNYLEDGSEIDYTIEED